MPAPWFAVEQEKPDIGTVVFKTDDYYERLQHLTGLWDDTNFLFSEMIDHHESESSSDDERKKDADPKRRFTVDDIDTVPVLLAFLERANMKGKIPNETINFLWELYEMNVRKMGELGLGIRYMSSKEFYLIDNREKWKKLMTGMHELMNANQIAERKVRRRKRMLKPATLNVIKTMEAIPGVKVSKKGSLTILNEEETMEWEREKFQSKMSKVGKHKKDWLASQKIMKKLLQKGASPESAAFATFAKGKKPTEPADWDYGASRSFCRHNPKPVSRHYEFTRWYHKVSRALRFSKYEPVDWRTISLAELQKHCYQNDCWMAIKGRVYDITEYLKNGHPGGGELIMQGAGSDATELFIAVHPYVVFYKDLAGMQIGTLPKFQEHRHTEWEPPLKRTACSVCIEWMHRPKNRYKGIRPKTFFWQTDTEYVYTVEFPEDVKSVMEDWNVTIVDGFQVTVTKQVESPYIWYGGFDLRTHVLDDTVYRKFSTDFNCLQLTIAKSYKVKVKNPIKDFRMDHGFFLSCYSVKTKFRVSIVQRTGIVTGVKLYGITLGMNKYFGCPIGSYVNLKILDETRPYTPVCLLDEFENKYEDTSGGFQTLFFIIKEFKDGNFTSMLHHMPIKVVLMGVHLYMGMPMGNFKTDFLYENMDSMILFAGGTGISVMTRIIQEYISQSQMLESTNKSVILVQCTQRREGIIWQEKWQELARKYKWFHYFYILSRTLRYKKVLPKRKTHKGNLKESKSAEALHDRSGRKEEVSVEIMEFDDAESDEEMYGYPSVKKMKRIFSLIPELDTPESESESEMKMSHKAIVCGPYGFNQSVSRTLKEFKKHETENVYYFAG